MGCFQIGESIRQRQLLASVRGCHIERNVEVETVLLNLLEVGDVSEPLDVVEGLVSLEQRLGMLRFKSVLASTAFKSDSPLINSTLP